MKFLFTALFHFCFVLASDLLLVEETSFEERMFNACLNNRQRNKKKVMNDIG